MVGVMSVMDLTNLLNVYVDVLDSQTNNKCLISHDKAFRADYISHTTTAGPILVLREFNSSKVIDLVLFWRVGVSFRKLPFVYFQSQRRTQIKTLDCLMHQWFHFLHLFLNASNMLRMSPGKVQLSLLLQWAKNA